MKGKCLILISLVFLGMNSCKNKGTKPLLPYFLGEELNEVWILPQQEKKAFVKFPNFTLKDQFDVEIKSKHLSNKAFVVNFFYGDCERTCNQAMKAMDSLQNRLFDDEVLFLSISIEADKDSLITLQTLSEKFNTNPEKWRILGGDPTQINSILKQIFNIKIEHPKDFKNFNSLFLFDKFGYLRGIYHLKNQVAIENLILDTRLFRQ
tara:strand:- start:19602 stop:20222 length:621 start_codon:yes stop_codon:yes gene_type:complete